MRNTSTTHPQSHAKIFTFYIITPCLNSLDNETKNKLATVQLEFKISTEELSKFFSVEL